MPLRRSCSRWQCVRPHGFPSPQPAASGLGADGLTDADLDALADRLAQRLAPALSPPSSAGSLLTLEEVAGRLNLGQRTVETLIAEGELPVIRVTPRTRRFDPAAVDALVRRRTRQFSR